MALRARMLTGAALFAIAACPATATATAKDAPPLDPNTMTLAATDLPAGTTAVHEDHSADAGVRTQEREFVLHGARLGHARLDRLVNIVRTGDDMASLFATERRLLRSPFGRAFLSGLAGKHGHVKLGRIVNTRLGDASFAFTMKLTRHGRSTRLVFAELNEGRVTSQLIISARRGSRLTLGDVRPLLAGAAAKVHAGLLPHPLTPPAISGTPQAGQTLTASPGTWDPATIPTSFAYQWSRCDAAGNVCQPVPGATARTYAVTSADAGATVRVTVTAADDAGTTAAQSAPVAVAMA